MSPDCHFLNSNVKSISFLSIAAPFMMRHFVPAILGSYHVCIRTRFRNFFQVSQRRSVVTLQLFTWRMPRLVPCFFSFSCTVKNHHCIRSIVRCSYVFEFLFLKCFFFLGDFVISSSVAKFTLKFHVATISKINK